MNWITNDSFAIVVLSLIFSSTNGQVNPLAIWKLDNPTTNFDSESDKFSLTYGVHEAITDSNVKAKIFTSACQNPADGSKGIEVSDGITVEKMGAADGTGSLEFVLDVPTLTQNKAVFDTTDAQKPMIKLCARYMLWTPQNEVNFIESLLNVRFDMTSEMEISFSGFESKLVDSSGNDMS